MAQTPGSRATSLPSLFKRLLAGSALLAAVSPVAAWGPLLARHRFELGVMSHYSGDASMPYHATADSNGCARGAPAGAPRSSRDQARSNRSRFITLAHAAAKSCTNLSFASSHA